jgi:hypothetical protein
MASTCWARGDSALPDHNWPWCEIRLHATVGVSSCQVSANFGMFARVSRRETAAYGGTRATIESPRILWTLR